MPFGAAVLVWQRRAEGLRYLVLHRSHKGPDYEGDWAWGHPAGCILPDEPVAGCAARELLEETGLALTCTLAGSDTEDWPLYLAEAPADAQVTLSDEHDAYRWLPADEAAALSLPAAVGEQIRQGARLLGDPAVVGS